MKKSDLVNKLSIFLNNNGIISNESYSQLILDFLAAKGMEPPKVKARVIRGEDYPWGAGCTMRCSCDECNPNYPINTWEPE